MRYLRLLRAFASTELQFAVEYRANLAFDLIQQLIVTVTSVFAVTVLYGHTTAINGWTLDQMVVLLGVYYIIQGANDTLFETSFERFMEHVRLGTLDFILLKPANSQFMISTRYVRIAGVGGVLLGLILVGVGAVRVGEHVGAFEVLAFALTLACGLALVYSLLMVLSTLSFWLVRIENLLAIFWSFLDAGRFPVDIYPGWLRLTLSTIVPIGIAVTISAEAVAGRLDGVRLATMVGGTGAVWLFAAWFWRQGVKSYTGASA
jgi:ABC-2 type transport system permease protein